MDPSDWARTLLEGMPLPGTRPDLDGLLLQHPALRDEVARLDFAQAAPLLAGLLTLPSLQANSSRIEAVVALCFGLSRGRTKARRRVLFKIFNRLLANSAPAQFEDPVEDVFVSNVVTPAGNCRVFEGLWESSDYWLQDVVRVISTDPGEQEWIGTTIRPVRALLSISELVANRLGLVRFSVGGGHAKGKIPLPPEEQILSCARAVMLSNEDLRSLSIDWSDLDPFLARRDEIDLAPGFGRVNDYLERRPLTRVGDAVLLLLPAGVSPAIRRFVVSASISANAEEHLAVHLRALQCHRAFDIGICELDGELVDLAGCPEKPRALDNVDATVCRFDVDKLAHVVVIHDDPRSLDSAQFSDLMRVSEREYIDYITASARHLAAAQNGRGGLTIVLVAGFGRGAALPVPALPERWHCLAFGLPDWLALGTVEEGSILNLWKLKQAEVRANSVGISIHNINGDFNAFAYWSGNDFRIVPHDFPVGERPGGLFLATDFVASVRADSRKRHDSHAALMWNRHSWIEVQRFAPSSYFSEGSFRPVYASAEFARAGELCGMVETDRGWWVRASQPPHLWQRPFVYGLWECIISWLEKLAPALERMLPGIPEGPIDIELILNGFELFPSPEVLPDDDRTAEPRCNPDARLSRLELNIPIGFTRLLNRADNAGERALIEAIALGVSTLANSPLDADARSRLVADVVGSEGARFLHVFDATEPRDILSHIRLPRVRLLAAADVSDSRFGLGWLADSELLPGRIQDTGQSIDLLNRVVDALWNQIRERLAQLGLGSAVLFALRNVEGLDRDANRWRRAAQALESIYEDKGDVVRAAYERDSERNRTALASRVLIEMAVCTSPPDGREVGYEDFDWLTARVCTLIAVSSFSDALHRRFSQSAVLITPSGDIRLDSSYEEAVVAPYTEGLFAEQFDSAAKMYASYFARTRSDEQEAEALAGPDFCRAFRSEYGLALGTFLDAMVALETVAISQQAPICQLDRADARAHMGSHGVPPADAEHFLAALMLPRRRRWNEFPPAGFSQQDWYPWRYGRRLSALARPLIPVAEDSSRIAFSISLLQQAGEHLVDRSFNGQLPESFFKSPEMRSWIGAANHRAGAGFTNQVAERLRELGWQCRTCVSFTELGGPDQLGDVDVLAWLASSGEILAIECKRLHRARTPAEIGEQIARFRGEAKDSLGRHMARAQWLKENVRTAVQRIGLQDRARSRPRVRSYVVTNTVVPIQFVRDLAVSPKTVVHYRALDRLFGRRKGAS